MTKRWLNRNLPCFECGSSDAMQESEHHFKCFSCTKTFLKRDINMENTNNAGEKVEFSNNRGLLPVGEFYDLKSRLISKVTAQKYKISCLKFNGTFGHGDNSTYVSDHWVFLFNRYANGKLISQKLRSCADKNLMKQVGDTKNKDLYGQQLYTPNPNRPIIITEGEFDAAVVNQETDMAAVSVNSGAGGAVNDIKSNIDWLSKWAYAILAFDNDSAGEEARQKVLDANIFEPGKVRIAYWPSKDANDLLLEGRSLDIRKTLWNAEEYRPKDIFKPSDCLESALTKPVPGTNTPWTGLTEAIAGFSSNNIITIAAADGIGKTEVVDEIIAKMVSEKKKIWLYSCEQEPEDTLRRQAGKKLDLPLHLPGAKWDEDKIKESILSLDDLLYMWRPETSVTTESFLSKMKYVHIAYGVKYFILDHLKGIESQLLDPNRGMGKFISDLKGFVKVHDSCVILLSHVAKDKKQGKVGQEDESWNRGRVPTKESVFGSSAINAWSNIVIGLSRNVEADDPAEACITKMSILKNRLLGNRGSKTIYLQYIEDTGRLIEMPKIDYEELMDKDDEE